MISSKKVQKSSKLSDIEILESMPIKVELIQLKDRLSHYKYPVKKVSDLVRAGVLFPLQRGLFLNVKSSAVKNFSLEQLANSLLFPSYISAEWALQIYGLLTDRVHTITSVTMGKSKSYETPFGTFTYDSLKKNRYVLGYQESESGHFWIARPEKALIDLINLRIGKVSWQSSADINEFLEDDLRIHVSHFIEMVKAKDLEKLLPHYHRNSKEHRVLKWVLKAKEAKNGKSY